MSNPLPQFPENKAPLNIPSIIYQQGNSLVLALFVIIMLIVLGDFLWV